jgi:hypothetical protein
MANADPLPDVQDFVVRGGGQTSAPANEEERDRQFFLQLGAKTAIGVVTYPLTFAKTLFQLGYEPYALSTGKVFIAFGRGAYFLPNAFSYLRNIYNERGFLAFYAGVEAGVLANVTGGMAAYAVDKYLDRYYPEVGGEPDNLEKEEHNLSHHESARVKIRSAIRESIARTVGTIVSRPLTVVMIREIAQIVGREGKYPHALAALLRIGDEEGPRGFFAGLVPQLLADYLVIWGIAGVTFAAERLLQEFKIDDSKDEQAQKAAKDTRFMLKIAIPFVVNSFSYPLNVVSTVLAVNGSGLVVSLLPYSPSFTHWSDAYDYLKPLHGLTRGARLFLREQRGAVSVGPDHQLYASNKHFI